MRPIALSVMLCLLLAGCSERRPSPANNSSVDSHAKKSAKEESKMKPSDERIKNAFPPQVAGSFYPSDPRELREQVSGFLRGAKSKALKGLERRDIVAIMAPHAGYVYSGPVAGEAYRSVQGRAYRTVLVVALSHRRAAGKVSVLARPAYDTPLGSVKIDDRVVQKLLTEHAGLFESNEQVFMGEHSLEVQLPFLQVALPEAQIVPIIVAVRDEAFVAEVGRAFYDSFGKRGDVLIVASTDLTHFHPYDEAVSYDKHLLGLIAGWKLEEWKQVAPTDKGMCGFMPVLSVVSMFGKYDADKREVTLIDYRNSGDTAGDSGRGVVGYGAMAFSVDKGVRDQAAADFGPFTAADRKALMALAKQAVSAAANGETFDPGAPVSAILKKKGAAFVTLKKGGNLRGCIGHVIARVPLFQCVADVARSATIHDTRFSPVRPDELEDLSYEISVLTPPEPTTPDQVVVGRDGLIMSRGGRSGLLLPQVPVEWSWSREEFLASTCRKAGLPLDCWRDPETTIESFRAIVWGEDDLED